ncbi:hypothetical protein WR25_10021 [Diploscapter pachys]|uniref:SUEL-type lectin domain-containing protein n=1 Tax=Diploscapter pachys TaxID=2018661 RepID=A0A2A2L5I1_9BILA|nr:hypothetical protein WR25_10021 [Diploscapter pachys]
MQESLRSHRVQACDGEQVTLQCPKHTQIIIETGFYGRVVPESQLCPGRMPSQGKKTYDETCDVIQAHTRLSELCDKRRKCTITVDAKTFEGDPCPSTSKYLQMSYKCKPVSFEGESFCTGSQVKLECREGKRLAIYTATYGRTVRGHVADCLPPKSFVQEEKSDPNWLRKGDKPKIRVISLAFMRLCVVQPAYGPFPITLTRAHLREWAINRLTGSSSGHS